MARRKPPIPTDPAAFALWLDAQTQATQAIYEEGHRAVAAIYSQGVHDIATTYAASLGRLGRKVTRLNRRDAASTGQRLQADLQVRARLDEQLHLLRRLGRSGRSGRSRPAVEITRREPLARPAPPHPPGNHAMIAQPPRTSASLPGDGEVG